MIDEEGFILQYRPKIFCAVSSYFRDSVSVKWDLETKEKHGKSRCLKKEEKGRKRKEGGKKIWRKKTHAKEEEGIR